MAVIPYLDVQNLTKSFGERTLFENISFSVSEGQRVGLIAQNGEGKSTLLSILTDEEGKDSGSVIYRKDLKIGFLHQSPHFEDDETVLDACFNHQGNEEKVLRAKQVLTQLKITDTTQKMGTLSGGQQKRVALANVLLTDPDFLILDEPTNHLDLDMIVWLENYLSRGNKTLLMVTHDRYFLDRVCNVIIELDNKQLYTYQGNFAYYLEKRDARMEALRSELQHLNNLYRRELEWMRRQPQARGHKAKYREDAFYELEQRAKQRIEERQVRLKNKNVYIGSKIFECQYVSKAWDEEHIILKDFYYNFARYEKMGIVGNNGTGKSTFIKMLLGEVLPDRGRFDIGETVKFGYFSQDGMSFDKDQKVIDAITDIAEYVDMGGGKHLTASQLLQHFLFSTNQQHDYIYKLSGGEQRKLYLCSVLMQSPNFLVLDEPTNDLDIKTLAVLENYLQDFPGCVIIVSHDRYFMDKVVDHLLVFEGQGKITDFPGNYTQYREWKGLQTKVDEAKTKALKTNNNGSNGRRYNNADNKPRKKTYSEKREFEQLETDIVRLETEQKEIEDLLCSGTLAVDALTEKSKRLSQIKDILEEKEMRWLELSELA